MENCLYDELLQEIFQKLPASSSCSVSLVCKRWLHLYRFSRTSLSLKLDPSHPSLSSFLSHHPFLSSLSLSLSPPLSFSPHLISLVSSCSNLVSLSLSPAPFSFSSLISLSTSCPRLTCLSITLPRPIFLNWILSFPSLKSLSIALAPERRDFYDHHGGVNGVEDESQDFDEELQLGLGLEALSLVGIRGDDWGVGWLWKRCTKIKKLRLQSCQGIGGSYSSFVKCLQNLEEIEVTTCRSVIYGVLLELVEHCGSLSSVLVHDGGSREGLMQFLTQSRCNIQKLDLRLPLDLNNDHLTAMAANFRGLTTLRLQSCCLVTGEGLKAFAAAHRGGGLQEMALVNCDVVEREPGLLATLGQQLTNLRKLDLSYNEMLLDKDCVSMLVSCVHLVDLRVRGCKGLTSVAVASMVRSCKHLQSLDIVNCFGIDSEAVEFLVKNSSCLRRIEVDGSKISDAAKTWGSSKFIEFVV